jgi:predicted aspartyl protease
MGRFKVAMQLTNNKDRILAENGTIEMKKVRTLKIQGVVDSGATRLVLPASVVKKLGLTVAKQVRVRYADRRVAVRDAVQEVHVELLGRDGNFTAIVEPKRRTALIGAIVLEDLDFLVDCTLQKLVPRNSKYIVSEIE